MADEEHLAILRQRVEAGHARDPERLLRAAGQVVVKDVPEERHCSFGEAVAANALEAVVGSLRKRPANAAAGVWIETKRGIGYRLLIGGDA
jgi:two-component system, OmpR family, response regulator QseB